MIIVYTFDIFDSKGDSLNPADVVDSAALRGA